MAKAKKNLHKLKSKKSTKKTLKRIQNNLSILNKIN
jgi:hypothetical protein